MIEPTIKKKIFKPVNRFVKFTRRWSPPGFQGLSLYRVLKYIAKEFDGPHLMERASAISYNFIMSLPPTCLFLFTLFPNLPFISKKEIKFQLHGLIHDVIPSQNYNSGIISFVDSFIDGSKIGLISFTFILSLFFASSGVMGLMRSFNRDYIGFQKIRGLKKRWEAIKLTLMLFGLLLAFIVLLFLQNNILGWLGVKSEQVRSFILVARWVFMGLLIFYSFAFVLRYAPSTCKRWKLLSPGAVIATFLSIVVTIGFTTFVNNFGRYNILYGSIGTVMVVMVMIFLNSLVVLVGFTFNLSIHTIKSEHEQKRKARLYPNSMAASLKKNC
ncbi:MAG: YihY/virulence factor BrkB family protein [Ginsengibacter sp.]